MRLSSQAALVSRESEKRSGLPANQTRVLVAAAVLAFGLKLVFAFATYGTNDVMFWEANARKIEKDGGIALYRDGAIPLLAGRQYRIEPFNQPPFMVSAVRAGAALADFSGIPFRACLRVVASLADVGTLLTVWGLLGIEKQRSLSRLLPLALSPVLVLVSGFHGNTDSVMMLFLLLAVYLIERNRPGWAGASMGMAANIKVVPVIFVPVMLLSLSTMRARLKFLALSAVVWLSVSGPYLIKDPLTIIHQVFGYSSQTGIWGFTSIATLIFGEAVVPYLGFAKLAPLVLCLAGSWGVSRPELRASLFQRCGFIAFLLMFTLSGWALQYLVWIVPWMAALPWKTVRVHYLLLGLFVIGIYGFLSYWHFWIANMLDPLPSPGLAALVLMVVPVWISTGIITWYFWRDLRGSTEYFQGGIE